MTIDVGGLIWLVGAGKMGSAMAAGWLEQGLNPADLFIQDPAPCKEAQALIGKFGLVCEAELRALPAPEIIVLAVKPQLMADVLPELAEKTGPQCLFLSIAAGTSLASLAAHLGSDRPIVRAMPNTPASIGRGMSVACANTHVSNDQVEHCITLLSAIGDIAWIEKEAQMDAVTAVSGSGPAYLFALTECLAKAGIEQGLDDKLSWQLARATMTGAGALMRRSTDDPATLRRNVTSPGGTTEAALNVLLGANALPALMNKAVEAATKRSRELSKE